MCYGVERSPYPGMKSCLSVSRKGKKGMQKVYDTKIRGDDVKPEVCEDPCV